MNPYRTEAPELLSLKLRLSVATHVDPYEFAIWIRAHVDDLRDRFKHCDEPTDTDRRVENTQGIWLRQEYRAELELNSAYVPTITKADCPRNGSEPAGDLVGFMYEQARRKLL
jgi:hypothetical protein